MVILHKWGAYIAKIIVMNVNFEYYTGRSIRWLLSGMCVRACMHAKSLHSCLALSDPMDCSLPVWTELPCIGELILKAVQGVAWCVCVQLQCILCSFRYMSTHYSVRVSLLLYYYFRFLVFWITSTTSFRLMCVSWNLNLSVPSSLFLVTVCLHFHQRQGHSLVMHSSIPSSTVV